MWKLEDVEKSVKPEQESNAFEATEVQMEEVVESSASERAYDADELARKHPSALIFMGLFTAWLGYHWMVQFKLYLKSFGDIGAGGVVLFIVYPLLASMVLVGLNLAFKGLKALFTS